MSSVGRPLVLAGTLVLGACAVAPPTGPSVMVLPAQGTTFEAFQQDDFACRQFASQQIGNGSPAAAATTSAVNSTAAGTLLGAAAGAAIGAAAGNPALGAAIGGGSGLLFGSAAGANAAGYSSSELQRRYDIGYIQCMSAKGQSVPQIAIGYAVAPSFGGFPVAYGYPYPAYYAYPYPWGWGWGGPAYASVGFGFGFRSGWHGRHWHR